jgi:hypothetical protein
MFPEGVGKAADLPYGYKREPRRLGVDFTRLLDGLCLYPEQTGAFVKIHQRAVISRPDKSLFQFVKKNRSAGPGVSLFPLTEFIPAGPQCFIFS